ncbi:MAG: carbamoyltransferase HypF [Thermodesulfobacteriota bacterium]
MPFNVNHDKQGVELTVTGVVQGVGFRPFVHRLAEKMGLTGSVANSGRGVVIRLAPPLSSCFSLFVERLCHELPPLARIESISEKWIPWQGPQQGFHILASADHDRISAMIPPDAAVCADCLAELSDPADRRHCYPFINCTNCGPRFSIIESVPYDRPQTSMKGFAMCPACAAEYHDPADRRFHAQPNACHECGPQLSWHDGAGLLITGKEPLTEAARALRQGKIVAVRGLGGFHLAVDAANEEAVRALRERKKRKTKPLAVMVADLATARAMCHPSFDEEAALSCWRRPIVLLRRAGGSHLASSLAPGINRLGVMLPYTPFHHLLFSEQDCPAVLVMTSGNRGGEPICIASEEAMDRLAGIADFFLLHNRDIVNRVDDSVVRVVAGKTVVLRRSRGYVPEAVRLPQDIDALLACGAELKNTFCLAQGGRAVLSQHVGDLVGPETLNFFQESIANMKNLLDILPKAAVCDLHPDYLSSRHAAGLDLPLYRVQHHHAHAAAVMAEHGLDEEVIAVIMDGSGFGPDNTVWGGEILLTGLSSYKRLGRLEQLLMPGGDAAAREPWRMGLAALWQAWGPDGFGRAVVDTPLAGLDGDKQEIIRQMMAAKVNSPATSSCGRLFDAVASLLAVRQVVDYEGQAAMELESLADEAGSGGEELLAADALRFPVILEEKPELMVIRSSAMIRALVDALGRGVDRARLARLFHHWLIEAVSGAVIRLTEREGRRRVVLGGGCMQNGLLLAGLTGRLEQAGFAVYCGEKVPVNDGGIALGQAMIGGLLAREKERQGREIIPEDTAEQGLKACRLGSERCA